LAAALIFVLVLSPFCALGDETKLTPSIEAKQAYNDNVFFDSRREYKQEDFISTLTPGLELTNKSERMDARLKASLPLVYYADLKELNSVDHNYSGSLSYRLTQRLSASLNGGFIRDSQPDRDIDETGLVLGDTRRDRSNAGVSVGYMLNEITSASLSYAYENQRYEDPGYTDIESHSGFFSITRDLERLIPRTVGRLSLGATFYDFSNSTVSNYSAMMGASHRITELFSISADLGIRYTCSEFEVTELVPVLPPYIYQIKKTEREEEDTGLVGRASVNYQDEYNRAALTFYRDIATSTGRSGTTERTSLVVDIGRRFLYELWGHISAGWYLNDSKNKDYSLSEINEETWRVSPYARYNFTRDLGIEVSYTYTKVDYRTSDASAERSLVFLRLVYQLPFQL
jgi:predicted porin